MERLTGLDASFLYSETATVHMHTLKVAVLDRSPAAGELSLEELRHEIDRRLHLLPPFRRRLVEVPMRFHHPVWIEDPDFDITYHVRRATVPSPGGRREMDGVIAEIAGWPLDRRRPLWQLFALDGLADGRLAVLVKVHHAVADGVAAAELLANVMASDPEEVEPAEPLHRWQPEQAPGRWALVRDAARDRLRLVGRLPALLWLTLRNVVRAIKIRRNSDPPPPRPILDVPKTSFNQALSPHRSFATTRLSLGDARRLRRVHGVTLNDVVLALVGGALRRYLDARGELPDRSLVASVPVGTDVPGTRRLGGNRVSNLFTTTGSAIPDPEQRLRAVHEVTLVAKEVLAAMGPQMMEDWMEHAPPRVYSWLMRQYGRHRLAHLHPPAVNLVVSNVPGPRQALYAAGARLDELYSVGPVLEGIGLNITVWSYLDNLFVGALACREAVPDAHEITACLEDEMAEMVALAEARERRGTAPTGRSPDRW